jgi:hypothetical protein
MSTSHDTDAGIDSLYSYWPGTPPVPAPCPEALFSVTLKGTIGGHEALLTARGQTAAQFLVHVEALKGLLDPVQPVLVDQGEGWCTKHQVSMKHNAKNGKQWWSHHTAEGWCKGK